MSEGSVEIGTGYISIVPSAKGFLGKLQSQVAPASDTVGKDSGKRIGSGLSGGIMGAAKAVAGPLAAAFAGVKVIDFLGDSVKAAEESARVGKVTEQVIKSTGGAANMSAEQVGKLSAELSKKTGVDDELIQSGANLLLTFQNIKNEAGKGNDVFNRANAAAGDLAAAGFGSIETNARLMGKALNDPLKGMTALSRMGIVFDEGQKKQIETLVKSGKTLEAQKVILEAVEGKVGGTAEASATMSEKMATAWENFQEDIGAYLLPVMESIGGVLVDTVLPAMSTAVAFISEKAGPVIERLSGFFTGLWETVGKGDLGRVFGDFQQEGSAIQTWIDTSFMPAFNGIIEALKGLWNNIQPIIAAIGQLIIEKWQQWGPTIMGVFATIREAITNAMTVIMSVINIAAGVIGFVWNNMSGLILGVLGTLFDTLVRVFTSIWNIVGGIWKTLSGLLTGDFGKAFEGLKQIGAGIWGLISGLFTGLGNIVWQALNWIKNSIVGIFTTAWQWLSSTFGGWWAGLGNILMAPINWGKNAIAAAWNGITGFFMNSWNWIKNTFGTLWGGLSGILLAPVNMGKRAIETALNNILVAFGKAKVGIANVWGGIKSAFSAPVKWIANTVVNPLLRAIKTLLNTVGLSSLGDKISMWDFQGFEGGGWTGPGPAHAPAGIVHADEFVIRKESRRRFESAHPGALGYLNMYGRLPGYDVGGRVRPVPGQWTTYSGHRGIDFPVPSGTPVRSWGAGRVSLIYPGHYSWGKYVKVDHGGGLQTAYAHLSRIATQVGSILAAGQVLGYVGSTGNSTGPHLHWEVWRNGTRVFPAPYLSGSSLAGGSSKTRAVYEKAGSSGSNPLIDEIAGMINNAAKPFLKAVPGGGIFASFLDTIPNKIVQGFISKAKSLLGFAAGTNSATPGLHWVGEHGPELVNFAGGEQVFSNSSSEALPAAIAAAMVRALREVTFELDGEPIDAKIRASQTGVARRVGR